MRKERSDKGIPKIPPEQRKNVISLGGGVQSSTMTLMASEGLITPMPDAAIFADTEAETKQVYEWLDYLGSLSLPFPIYRVSKGNLAHDSKKLRLSKNGNYYQKYSPPLFTIDHSSKGLLMRQCTQTHKIQPIVKKMRELGFKKTGAVQWLGISTDESHRIKPAKVPWINNRFPLIEMGMNRQDCLNWMKSNNYPVPPRSSCVFCPYRSNKEWKSLDPEEFKKAIDYEKEMQHVFSKVKGFSGQVFLHKDCKPLNEVKFNNPQLDLWGNECEGVCGL